MQISLQYANEPLLSLLIDIAAIYTKTESAKLRIAPSSICLDWNSCKWPIYANLCWYSQIDESTTLNVNVMWMLMEFSDGGGGCN